jgi:anaerobic selenocysteine-containing dehydrogenase
MASRGLKHGDVVDIETVAMPGDTGDKRVMRGITAVAFDIAKGSAATYYPEANGLIDLSHYDVRSGTPSYKSIPVRIVKAAPAAA